LFSLVLLLGGKRKRKKMAEPKLQIEERMDRIEEAVGVIAQVALGEQDVEEIERILRGEKSEEPNAGQEE
jgi:hypothetical protein